MSATGAVPLVRQHSALRLGRAAARGVGRRKAVALGVAILATFTVIAVFAPLIEPYSITHQAGPVFAPPSGAHLLGLDGNGIDMLSLLIAGAQVSMLVGALATAIAVGIGGSVGVLAGYFGGRVDRTLMHLTDYFIVIPVLPLMIVVADVWGPSVTHSILIIGLLSWTVTARVIRAQVLIVRERSFVRRARALGAGHIRVIVRHVLPQVRSLLVANTVITVASAIFFEAALAFFGLESATTNSWGTLIANAFDRSAMSVGAWWAIIPPGLCIVLVVLGCSLIGMSLEDAGNPRILSPHIFSGTPRLVRSHER